MKKTITILNICLAFVLLFGSISTQAQIKVANGGNVGIGIGTATPTYKLQVTGNMYFNSSITTFKPNSSTTFIISSEDIDPVLYPSNNAYGYIGTSSNRLYKVYSDYFYYNLGMVQLSDERAKTNIKKISIKEKDELGKLNKINIYQYDYKEDLYDNIIDTKEYTKQSSPQENISTYSIEKDAQNAFEIQATKRKQKLIAKSKNQTGVIAQELKEIFPELVVQDDKNDMYSVNYVGLIPHLVLAIQELTEKNKNLETQMTFMQLNCCNNFAIDPKPIKDIKPKNYTQTTQAQTTIVARLDQNIPNPFTENTQISCLIPEQSKQAQLCVYDLTGKQLKQYPISQKGETAITIQGQELQAGIYLYALLIDGQLVDSKKMVLTK